MVRSQRFFSVIFALVAIGFASGRVFAADFYASPTGTTSTAAGTGSLSNPWALATALAHPAAVQPGDTIWLRGGTYTGRVSSSLTGTAVAPIKVRPYQSERAKLDGGPGPLVATLTVYGQYTWYWGFEVFSSEPNRRSTQDGSWPTDLNRGSCVGIAQDIPHVGIRLINLVLHDGTDAIGSFQSHQDGEIYGNLIFNNGWNGATDRGHGHGLYVQNQAGTKKISDNVIFNQYGGGMQIYGSAAAYLDNIQVTGNTIFSAGWPSAYGCDRNFLFGGDRIATNGTVVSNSFYYPDSFGACTSGGSNIGYNAGVSNFTIQNNWFANGDGGISSYFFGAITGLTMTGNHFLQDISGVVAPASYPSNTYHGTTKPTGTYVYVRPNAYEIGRANITVFNWDKKSTVAADLSAALAVGQAFEVRNAQDFFGAPVLTGTYAGGSITLPMSGLTVAAPIGGIAPPPTGPEFNVFVVLPLAGAPTCSFTLGALSASTAGSGGTGSDSVSTGATCGWAATSNAAWLTISGGASGMGNGSVNYSVAANPNCTSRSGSLTIAGQTFMVTQSAGSPSASISPTAATTGAGAGGGSIAVTIGTGCAWTATSNAAWLTISGGASGMGNGSVTYSVASNPTCTSRSGSLTVAGKTFTVTQSAGSATASISPTATSVGAGASGGSVAVTIGTGCAWTASSNAAWLTVSGGGTGNGTATYTVASNSGCARTGTLTVAGRTFTVSQSAGASCSGASGFYPVTPCRAIDTRQATGPLGGPILAAGARRVFPITTSVCGVPSTAKSIAVTVTAVRPAANGTLHAYPGDLAPTAASILSFRKNRTQAATALLLLATDGSGGLGVQNESTGTLDVIVDVSGYFR